MTPNEYQKLALRTNTGSFYGDRIGNDGLISGLDEIAELASVLDQTKKVLFYGKPNTQFGFGSCSFISEFGQKYIDVLHGVIGVLTESGELIEAILPTYDRHDLKPFDEVNLKEEIGDVLWYCAILANALGTDLESIMETNIAKLKKRYPEGFTEDKAENRNLIEERKELEK